VRRAKYIDAGPPRQPGGARVKGRKSYVESRTVEKLWKVAQAIAEARDAGSEDVLVEAWPHMCV